jgi:Fanconi anemia group M protein
MMEIKGLAPRLYQERIFSSAAQQNTIAILPTGMGKTVIAMLLAVHRLKKFPDSKVLFLSPTKPLCEQHVRTFQQHLGLSKDKFVVLTGATAPAERKLAWEASDLIFATPQTITNDLVSGKLSLDKVSLLVVDEAHRATGDYDYVFLAKTYAERANNTRILALTASPGSEKSTIEAICRNLFIEKIEIRDESSPDVAPYMQKKEIQKIMIDLPDSIKELKELFERALKKRLLMLKEHSIIETTDLTRVKKRDLLMLQKKIGATVNRGDFLMLNHLSTIAACIKVYHCLELLQTQGIASLVTFIEGIKKQVYRTKASKNLVNDLEFREAMQRAFELEAKKVEHPKLKVLLEIVKEQLKTNADSKIIIFSNFRHSVEKILTSLQSIEPCKPVRLIGQAGSQGLTQKRQIEILKEFEDGLYNVLICTSIGEEGLSIGSLDLAIFFESVPSEIRTIQRSGRVGRCKIGKIVMLITKGTVDERYHWMAFHKEKRMKKILNEMKQPNEHIN